MTNQTSRDPGVPVRAISNLTEDSDFSSVELQRLLCAAITEEEYLEARVEVALAPLRRWLTPDRIDSIRKTMSELLALDPVVGELIRNLAKTAGAAQNQCAIRSLDAENAENNSQEFFTTAPPVQSNSQEFFTMAPPVQSNSQEFFTTTPPVENNSQEFFATAPPVQSNSQEFFTTAPPVQSNSQEFFTTTPPVENNSQEFLAAISRPSRGECLPIANVGHNTTGLEIVQTQMVGCWDSVSKSNRGG